MFANDVVTTHKEQEYNIFELCSDIGGFAFVAFYFFLFPIKFLVQGNMNAMMAN
jgi:hypothetical protein